MCKRKYIEPRLRTAILFINSHKAECNLHSFFTANKIRCIPYGFIQEEAVVDRSSSRNADRTEINTLLSLLETGRYEILIVRNLYELTTNEDDLEYIMNFIAGMNIRIFELDTIMYRYNAYDEE